MIHEWKGLHEYYSIETPKNKIILLKEHTYLRVSAAMFCKHFLAYTVHIDWSACLCNP